MELSDEVINLRPFQLSDAKEHLAGEDIEQIKWLSGGQSSFDGIERWIEKNQENWKNNGPIFNFAIIEESSGKITGMIEANSDYQNLDGLKDGDVNISYGIYPSFRGRGYATKAVILINNFLKEKGFKRAVIRINPENEKSLEVPARCGFEEGETLISKDGEKLKLFFKNL